MSDNLQLIRSEDLQGDSLWFADGQGCSYVNFVDFSGNDVVCDDRCLYVFSTASFVTQAIDVSPITSEVLRKPFVFSFQALARKLSLTDPDGNITIAVTDGSASTSFSMPLTSINSTDAKFTPHRFTFNLPPNARDGMNVTMRLKEPNEANRASVYFDELSLKLDPDYLIVVQPKSQTGAIVGGVIGGIALLLIVVGVFWFLNRRKKRAANLP